MSDFLTRKGATQVTTDIDRIASLVQEHHTTLGIPEKVAQDFCYRCDLISDAISKTAFKRAREAGLLPEDAVFSPAAEGLFAVPGAAAVEGEGDKTAEFDPDEIGKVVPGPVEQEKDEPFMKGQFTQKDLNELSKKQEAGGLSEPDRQAALKNLSALSEQIATLTGALTAEDDEEEKADPEAGKKAEESDDEEAGKKASLPVLTYGYDLHAS